MHFFAVFVLLNTLHLFYVKKKFTLEACTETLTYHWIFTSCTPPSSFPLSFLLPPSFSLSHCASQGRGKFSGEKKRLIGPEDLSRLKGHQQPGQNGQVRQPHFFQRAKDYEQRWSSMLSSEEMTAYYYLMTAV